MERKKGEKAGHGWSMAGQWLSGIIGFFSGVRAPVAPWIPYRDDRDFMSRFRSGFRKKVGAVEFDIFKILAVERKCPAGHRAKRIVNAAGRMGAILDEKRTGKNDFAASSALVAIPLPPGDSFFYLGGLKKTQEKTPDLSLDAFCQCEQPRKPAGVHQ